MAWQAIDRVTPAADDAEQPQLSDAVREKIRGFFPRYPTKRAALLPALHVVQETHGYISHRAMRDVAELLEIPPAQVLDTISFYTHFWTKHRGRKMIVACRSLSCELMGAVEVNEAIAKQLGVGEHGTTEDGAYSFATEECIGACEFAPCLLINERLHKCVKVADVPKLLADENNGKLDIERSELFDGVSAEPAPSGDEARIGAHDDEAEKVDAVLDSTSDVDEMKEAD